MKSVSPLKTTVEGFLILVVPTLVVSFIIDRSISARVRITIYILLGTLYSIFYLFIMAKLNLVFIERQLWVYVASGSLGGLAYGAILNITWNSSSSSENKTVDFQSKRKLLSSLGLLAGMTSLYGTLAGPFYFWKNRNTYTDVNVSRLEEGQLMTIEVANKPVWILKRSPDVVNLLEQENRQLLDPRSEFSNQPERARNKLRSIRPEYLVVNGICTHLGCSPTYLPDGSADVNPNPQFFCPCHGGVFDLAGRVYKGTPPPENMVVPAHEFISEDVIRIYLPSLKDEWNA